MPNRAPRHVVNAPQGSTCGFSYMNGGRPSCKGGKSATGGFAPAPAVHVLTKDLPVAPAGTPLCAYHSPYDVLRRYELTLTPDGKHSPRDVVHTFTWGYNRGEAYSRVIAMMDDQDGMWDGWSFTLADQPTPNVYA